MASRRTSTADHEAAGDAASHGAARTDHAAHLVYRPRRRANRTKSMATAGRLVAIRGTGRTIFPDPRPASGAGSASRSVWRGGEAVR